MEFIFRQETNKKVYYYLCREPAHSGATQVGESHGIQRIRNVRVCLEMMVCLMHEECVSRFVFLFRFGNVFVFRLQAGRLQL